MAGDAERVWIGLGGNVGAVRRTFAAARLALRAWSRAPLMCSPLVRSSPWGPVSQAPFLNQVVGMVPRLEPEAMLAGLLATERRHARVREERWGPRTLDLDILCWPGVVRDTAPCLPHPRLAERRFVLAPWAAVAPHLVVPGLDRTVGALLADCPDSGSVRFC